MRGIYSTFGNIEFCQVFVGLWILVLSPQKYPSAVLYGELKTYSTSPEMEPALGAHLKLENGGSRKWRFGISV